MNFTINNNLIYSLNIPFFKSNIKSNIKTEKIKIAGFDLDHTLIRPKNNKTFPKSKDDTEFVYDDILGYLNNLIIDKYIIIIFSNQSGLNNNLDKTKIVLNRIDYLYKLFPKFGIILSTKDDYMRKPNIGMWDFITDLLNKNDIIVDKKNSFYVGDAAGRIKIDKFKKDFACTDRMFAYNLKIPFFTPENFFRSIDIRENREDYIIINKAKHLFKIDDKLKKENELILESIKKFNIIILIGSPASGKSFLSNKLKSENYNILSNDKFKNKSKTFSELKKLLENNKNEKIIIDNTNYLLKNRKVYTDYFKDNKLNYCYVYININKEQSLFLNNYRCKLLKKEKLSPIAIHSYYKNLEYPTINEDYIMLFKLNFIPEFNNNGNKELFYQYY